MKSIKYCLFTLLAFVISFSGVNAQSRIPLDDQETEKNISVEIIKSNKEGYTVRVVIHGLFDEIEYNSFGEFHHLSIGNDTYLSKVGEPSLPLIFQCIAIPTGAKISAKITGEQWKDIDVGRIMPTQKSLLEKEQPKGFDYDENVYSNDYTPSLLTIGPVMRWRNIRNTNISVCPFKYYPQDKHLSVMKEFVLEVSFTYENELTNESVSEPEDPYCLFDNLPYKDVKQTKCLNDMQTMRSQNNEYYNYLIIVGNGMGILSSDKMKEFQLWKALKGYKTKAVPTDSTGTTQSQIKSYIAEEYNKGVRYVLFVGDNNKIPLAEVYTPMSRYVSSDYWYGCLGGDNDYQAEIPIGRFSVESLTDFEHIVDKTIKYERSYNASNKTLLVAHWEYANQNESFQACCEQINTTHNQAMEFSTAYGSCLFGNNATNEDVVDEINEGAHIVNYRGHGAPTFWGGGGSNYWNYSSESFTMNEINNMDDGTCAVFFGVACQTGNIEGQTCMLETFTRSDHGAVAYIGSTEDTDHITNNGYNILLFDKLLTNNVYHLGDLNVSAHISNNLNNSNETKDSPFCYLCGGDPSLELWTSTPQFMSADLTANNGYITISTNLTGSYNVSIASETGERLDSISYSSSTCTFPIPANKFWIAINKHNFFPYIIYYDSVTNSIVNKRFTYDAYYTATPLDVTAEATFNDEDEGTIVRSGNKLSLKLGSGGVVINEEFECERGAELEIK